MAFTYILKCADATLYIGWTTDLERRLRAHESGRGARYSRGRLPVRLVYLEEHPTQRQARQREAVLRRLSRAEKLALIKGRGEDIAQHIRCATGLQ